MKVSSGVPLVVQFLLAPLPYFFGQTVKLDRPSSFLVNVRSQEEEEVQKVLYSRDTSDSFETLQ